jgi:hypothetical protein
LSWIPSEAVTGLNKAIFESGVTHYDDPPPDRIDDLRALRDADRFRFANHLAAWIDVDEHGRIADAGYSGGCVMGSTTVSIGTRQATFAAVAFDDIQRPVELTDTTARFVQTVGGHTAVPAPRRVNRPPFVKLQAPAVWSTLELTMRADGTSAHALLGASTFPRHWVYDSSGALAAKAGLADFKDWWRHSFGTHTPWGDEDSPAMVTAVESALERDLATRIMRGGERPRISRFRAGRVITAQGDESTDVYLVLNGVVAVDVDGDPVVEVGPGAILGVRAAIEGGRRTSTLRALTATTVAVIAPGQLAATELSSIAAGHRREQR